MCTDDGLAIVAAKLPGKEILRRDGLTITLLKAEKDQWGLDTISFYYDPAKFVVKQQSVSSRKGKNTYGSGWLSFQQRTSTKASK